MIFVAETGQLAIFDSEEMGYSRFGPDATDGSFLTCWGLFGTFSTT